MGTVLHMVKVTGKTKAELVKALYGAIRELEGETIANGNVDLAIVQNIANTSVDDSDDDMTEVESPYVGAIPSAHLAPNENEVDAEGLPWDARIHASSKLKTNKNIWKARKGVDAATTAQVKAELYSRKNQVQTAPVIMPPQQIQQPVNQVYQAPVQTPVQQPTAVPPMPQMNNGGHTFATFKANFPMIMARALTDGKIDQDYVNGLKSYFQKDDILKFNDQEINMIFEQFVEYQFVTRIG